MTKEQFEARAKALNEKLNALHNGVAEYAKSVEQHTELTNIVVKSVRVAMKKPKETV